MALLERVRPARDDAPETPSPSASSSSPAAPRRRLRIGVTALLAVLDVAALAFLVTSVTAGVQATAFALLVVVLAAELTFVTARLLWIPESRVTRRR